MDIEPQSALSPFLPSQLTVGMILRDNENEIMGGKDTSELVPPIAASISDGSSNSMAAPGCWGETGVSNGVFCIVTEGCVRCEVCLEA